MGHLLRNSKGMLMSVSATEGLPKACRERVEAALKKWLPVVAEYLATYDQYDEFVKSTIQVPFHCLPSTFHCLSSLHCFLLAFHCLSLPLTAFHCRSLVRTRIHPPGGVSSCGSYL